MKFFKRRKDQLNQTEIPWVLGASSSYSDWIRKNPEGIQQGVLYLLKSDVFSSYKIGITRQSSKSDRIEEHLKRGWLLIQTWTLENVVMAEAVEETVIEWWRRELKLKPSTTANDMPQGGYTETIRRNGIELSELVEFIETQCARKITRPSVQLEISDLNIGVRSIISGTVTKASINRQRAGEYKGKSLYTWTYKYLVTDGKKSVVVESHQKRRHAATPLVGYSVSIEGRPFLTSSREHEFGFINPSVEIKMSLTRPTNTRNRDCLDSSGHIFGAFEENSSIPDIYAGWKCIKCGLQTTENIDTRVICRCRKETLKAHVSVSMRRSKRKRNYVIPDSIEVKRSAFCRKCSERPKLFFYHLHSRELTQAKLPKNSNKDLHCSNCFLLVSRHLTKCSNGDDNCPMF